MEIEGFTITPQDDNTAILAWDAPDAASASTVYMNGETVISMWGANAVHREIEILMTAGEIAEVEVHESAPGETPPAPIAILPDVSPTFAFNRVPGAERYETYVGNTRVSALADAGVADIYRLTTEYQLAPGWHKFETKAFSAYGVGSSAVKGNIRIFGLPKALGKAEISVTIAPPVLTYAGERLAYDGQEVSYDEYL